jgi:hypothetical protein
MKRRIVSLLYDDGTLWAISDDGTAWVRSANTGFTWQQVEPLPDTDSAPLSEQQVDHHPV